MKKLIALMLAFGVTAGIAHAQTQVLSQNAVGYVKIEVEEGNIYLISNPFVNLDDGSDSFIVSEMLDDVPNNTVISIWNEDTQSYVSFGKSGRGVWDPAANTTLVSRAQSLFIRMPDSGGNHELFLMGEVPSEEESLQGRQTGISFSGFPYPASVSFTSTAFAVAAPNNTIVSVWDADAQAYSSFGKSGRGVWDPAAQAATIEPGQGFLIRSTAAPNTWDEIKPYTWP